MSVTMGDKIRIQRQRLHLTQKELAEKLYKSPQVISNWERGYTLGILPNDVQMLSEALKVSVNYFIESSTDNFVVTDDRLQRIIDNYPNLNEQAKAIIDSLLDLPHNYIKK